MKSHDIQIDKKNEIRLCEYCDSHAFPLLYTCYSHAGEETIKCLTEMVKYAKTR